MCPMKYHLSLFNLSKFYSQVTTIKSIVLTYKHINQWNRIERSEINPRICGQLIFDEGAEIHNGETILSSINGAGGEIEPVKK